MRNSNMHHPTSSLVNQFQSSVDLSASLPSSHRLASGLVPLQAPVKTHTRPVTAPEKSEQITIPLVSTDQKSTEVCIGSTGGEAIGNLMRSQSNLNPVSANSATTATPQAYNEETISGNSDGLRSCLKGRNGGTGMERGKLRVRFSEELCIGPAASNGLPVGNKLSKAPTKSGINITQVRVFMLHDILFSTLIYEGYFIITHKCTHTIAFSDG